MLQPKAMPHALPAAQQALPPQHQPQPPDSEQHPIPLLRTLQTMHSFWNLWQRGDSLAGRAAVSTHSSTNQTKRRFSEWKLAADVVDAMAAELPSGSSRNSSNAVKQVLERLEQERQRLGEKMPAFIKALPRRHRQQQQEAAEQTEAAA